jgi:hypothetical protein
LTSTCPGREIADRLRRARYTAIRNEERFMAGRTGVQVRLPSIEKEWRKLGGDDMWLQLRTTSGNLEDFAAAAAEMNAAVDEGVWAEAPSHAPQGFALLLTHCADRDMLLRWVAEFAQRLEGRGLTGALQNAPKVKYRAWFSSERLPEPTAYVAYTLDLAAMTADPYRTSHWHVPAAATARITEAADRWARLTGAELLLRQNIHTVAVDLDDTSQPLAQSLQNTGMAGLDFVDDANRRARHVSFTPGGIGLYQDVLDDTDEWQLRVERLRAALTALPADTAQGFIRPAVCGSLGIDTLDAVQPLPGIREYHAGTTRTCSIATCRTPTASSCCAPHTWSVPMTSQHGTSPTSATIAISSRRAISQPGTRSGCLIPTSWLRRAPTSPEHC